MILTIPSLIARLAVRATIGIVKGTFKFAAGLSGIGGKPHPAFNIQLKGFQQVQNSLNRKLGKVENTQVLNARLVLGAENWIQKNFQEQGKLAHPDTGWKPLSAATLMRRRKKGAGAKILMDTGTMRSRWKHNWNKRTGTLQSGVPYAAKHHYGWQSLPVRRIMPTEAQLRPIIKKIGEAWLKEASK